MVEDLVSSELRKVEEEIDSAFESSRLLSLSRSQAIWSFLAQCEETFVRYVVRRQDTPTTDHSDRAMVETVLNYAKWPLRWITSRSKPGDFTSSFNAEFYGMAQELINFGRAYNEFVAAYASASTGLLSLSLDGKRIVPSGPLYDGVQWEAYDWLVDASANPRVEAKLAGFYELITPNLRFSEDSFRYRLTPRLIDDALKEVKPILDDRFMLPANWQLTDYSLSDYGAVLRVLWVISSIHSTGRMTAVSICRDGGYSRALVVARKADLTKLLIESTGFPSATILGILRDLTYGQRGIRTPDPSHQPLVELDAKHFVWAPNFVVCSNFERNLLVLLNRSAEGRDAYATLSAAREVLFRELLCEKLAPLGFRFWWGNVPGWDAEREIDLALVSDSEKHVLVLELKSFIAPAEPRERREKSEEIGRGIEQIRRRRRRAASDDAALREVLGVDANFSFGWAVVSETSIGSGWVQDKEVPVVRGSHCIAKLLQVRQLVAFCKWLEARSYLPIEGRDFEKVVLEPTLAGWTLCWWGIKGLTENYI